MKITEKLKYIQDNHLDEWLKTKQTIENEISDSQSVYCLCGRLATGLHESHCKKFRNKIINESVKRLKYLFNSKQ